MSDYMTTVRIYNDVSDKRTFTRQMVQDFDDRECVDVGEFKGRVFELTKAYFGDEDISLDDVNVGFIGASNQKTIVNTSNQVEDAYDSRFLHKSNELVLFIERKKPEKRSARKRKSASTNGM